MHRVRVRIHTRAPAAALYRTVPHRTAPYRTVPHRTAPHRTALQITGSVKGRARAQVNEALAAGDIDIAVGTHALISDSTQFSRLGLAIVDEQHK